MGSEMNYQKIYYQQQCIDIILKEKRYQIQRNRFIIPAIYLSLGREGSNKMKWYILWKIF